MDKFIGQNKWFEQTNIHFDYHFCLKKKFFVFYKQQCIIIEKLLIDIHNVL